MVASARRDLSIGCPDHFRMKNARTDAVQLMAFEVSVTYGKHRGLTSSSWELHSNDSR